MSPQLSWTGAPEGTQSFAINMYDPDAPTGSGWWQWVIFDIPVSTTELVENAGNIDLNLAGIPTNKVTGYKKQQDTTF